MIPQDSNEGRDGMLPAVSGSASSTPGPWHCESSLGLVRSAADQRIICAMPHALNKRAIKMRKPGDDAEITPDARLIAAAPTMLAALRGVIGAWGGHLRDDGCGCADCEYLRPVEDAIREALGEESGNAALGLSRQNQRIIQTHQWR